MKSLQVSYLFLILLLFPSCRQKEFDSTGVAARVNDRVLWLDDVKKYMPPGLHGADSARVARLYINNWVEDEAAIAMAEKNIPETQEIDRMVEDYRRQLIMWEYRRQMTLQNGQIRPSVDEIDEYYDIHKSSLRLHRPVIKGVYIKIPDNARELPEIKRLYRSERVEDMDRLEKLMDRAVNYEYFRDKWTDWSIFEARIPFKELDSNPDAFPVKNDHLEITDDGYVYLLDISKSLAAGELMPRDYAENTIIEALERENAVAYDKLLRRQLADKAMREGVAEIFVPMQ